MPLCIGNVEAMFHTRDLRTIPSQIFSITLHPILRHPVMYNNKKNLI